MINYEEDLNEWKNNAAVNSFDGFEKIILYLAAGDDEKIERLTFHRTTAQVAEALISRLIQ